ncbi:HAD family hydrolase [Streptomyces sp. HNM0575]|uniref:HAD family hydrolase n=1 Tax=Streptomyces sp. HNM0575 TaxID=2716338 RepID=UPI00145D5CA2|nr:HAD-IA family hydrolase [Streptomyces sp. HNM0575]NLU74087.1 HAD family hydrolase [Streptomyces sp. HNM0575]
MRDLIEAAKCVLFDFDGPICNLFQQRPSSSIAERLRQAVGGGSGDALDRLPETDDPLEILRAVFEDPALVERGLARELEGALTAEEVAAAPGAFPTAYADALVRTLAATGRRLAVTTNNSQQAVERYLETRLTGELFAGRIHGRNTDGELRLKPDPDCLLRALKSTDTQAQDALMIGDAPRDLEAARAAGVAFLGYARNERKSEQLRAAGAEHLVDSLRDVVVAVDPRAHV